MVSATGNIRKEKSRKLTNYLRIKKGLKKKAFELSTLVGVDVCMIIVDPEQHEQGTDHCPVEPGTYPDNSQEVHRIIQRYREYITTTTTTRDEQLGGVSSTTGVLGGKKKKRRNNQDLIQKNPAEILVTSSLSSEQDDELLKGGTLLQNFETEEELRNKFMEELRNELVGSEQNVNINNQLQLQVMTEEEEEENLLDSSSEFLMEGDIWPSDELNEIHNGFGDNADNMFDMLPPLFPPPPLPLTDAFIDNTLNSTSDNWPTGTMVEWDQPFS